MKKRLSKILSMVCAMALISSLCPCFSVMADGTTLSDLTAEGLAVSSTAGNQIPRSIVANLTLPEGFTWESTNPEVIATDGTVTRPMVEDANVTLTAKLGEEEKSFSYTVKAKTKNVFFRIALPILKDLHLFQRHEQ